MTRERCGICGGLGCIAPDVNDIQWDVTSEMLLATIDKHKALADAAFRDWKREIETGEPMVMSKAEKRRRGLRAIRGLK